jgi:hypothetical protein
MTRIPNSALGKNIFMKRFAIRLVVALLTFLLGIGSAQLYPARRPSSVPFSKGEVVARLSSNDNSKAEAAEPECDPAIEGHYSNYDYAYAVDIPEGMLGFGSCVTNHGFGIDLTNPTSRHDWGSSFPNAYLYVDASYNSAELNSLDEAVTEEMSFLAEDKATDIRLESKTWTRLAGLRALRYIIRYHTGSEIKVEDTVLAFRGKDRDIIYTLSLSTPQARYEQDKAVMLKMHKSWHLQPLP